MAERHLRSAPRVARIVGGEAQEAWWYEEKGGVTVCVDVGPSSDGHGRNVVMVRVTQQQLRGYFGRLDQI